MDATRRRVMDAFAAIDGVTLVTHNTPINPAFYRNATIYPGLPEPSYMLRRTANIMSTTTEQPPLSPRRRLGASIRRRLGRIGRSKSPGSNETTPRSSSSSAEDTVPKVLRDGIFLTKISTKKQQKLLFRLDPDRGQLIWESKVTKYSMSLNSSPGCFTEAFLHQSQSGRSGSCGRGQMPKAIANNSNLRTKIMKTDGLPSSTWSTRCTKPCTWSHLPRR
jgi:hypothetical protein